MNKGMCWLRVGWNIALHVAKVFNTRRNDFNMMLLFRKYVDMWFELQRVVQWITRDFYLKVLGQSDCCGWSALLGKFLLLGPYGHQIKTEMYFYSVWCGYLMYCSATLRGVKSRRNRADNWNLLLKTTFGHNTLKLVTQWNINSR